MSELRPRFQSCRLYTEHAATMAPAMRCSAPTTNELKMQSFRPHRNTKPLYGMDMQKSCNRA